MYVAVLGSTYYNVDCVTRHMKTALRCKKIERLVRQVNINSHGHASRRSPSFDKPASEDSLSLAEGSDDTAELLRSEVPSTFLDEPCDFDAFLNLSREVVGKREVSGAREVAGESSEEVLLSEVLHAASTLLDEPTLRDCAALFFFITSAAAVLRVGSREVSGAREVAGESSEVNSGSIANLAFAAFTCRTDGVRIRLCGNAAREVGGVVGVADAALDAAVRSIRPEPTVPGAGIRLGEGIAFAAL